jgi:alpha-tubulin suppressor-like RCC1 family protein
LTGIVTAIATVCLLLHPGARMASLRLPAANLVAIVLSCVACGGESSPTPVAPVTPVATQLVFTVEPANTEAQTTFATAPTVEVRDAAGVRVGSSNAAVTLTLSGGAAGAGLRGTTTVNAVNGIATFAGLSIDSAGTSYRLTANATGLTSATSSPFTVAAIPTTLSIVSGNGQTGAPGQALGQPIRVRVVRAQGGAPVAGQAVTFAPSGGGTVTPATVQTGADGEAQTTWTMGTSGTQTLTVTTPTAAAPITVSATLAAPSAALVLTQLTAGENFFCGIQAQGGAVCWGDDNRGELGDGPPVTPFQQSRPVPVSGAVLTQVAAGRNSACGLTADGSARCWGSNLDGQLGDGTRTNAFVPVTVTGGQTYRKIAVGSGHACALTTTGAAFCWGANTFGELGIGSGGAPSSPDVLQPTAVSGGRSYVDLAVGFFFSCALDSTGQVWCWGTNLLGQLGNDNRTNSNTAPIAIQQPAGVTFTSIAAGQSHVCAIAADQRAYCWGANFFGSLGDGGTAPRATPTAVVGGLSFTAIAGGSSHTCAIGLDARGYCWGNNVLGHLGDGTEGGQRAEPGLISGNRRWTRIAASRSNGCGIEAVTGRTYCWGSSSFGALGDGGALVAANQLTPQAVLPVAP